MTKFLSLAGLQTFWSDIVQMVEDKIDDNAYELPAATSSTLGGVKPDGTTVTVDSDGTIHSTGGGGGGYTLPTMSASTKGGAMLGSGLVINNDTLSLDGESYTSAEKTKLAGIEAGAQVNPSVATSSANGLMAASDKSKLDGLPSSTLPYLVFDSIAWTSANLSACKSAVADYRPCVARFSNGAVVEFDGDPQTDAYN